MSIKMILFGLILIISQMEVSTQNKFAVPKRFLGNNHSVYDAFESLKAQYNLVELAEGKPNFGPPNILRNALVDAATGNYSLSQYSPVFGLPRLLKAIAKFYSRLLNRTLDPENNVIITVGATQALYTTFQCHTSPGDEWIVIEPAHDAYDPAIRASNGVPIFVPLKPKKHNGSMSTRDWTFDRAELSAAFNVRTKGIVLNTPHNPIGKVFTRDELEFIADLAKKWNTLVISDEVYEFATFDHNEHIRIATLPGMFERTITIGSGGKAFSATGLRLGWAYGDAKILDNLRFLHVHIVLNAPTPVQEAFAVMFENENENYGTEGSYIYRLRKLVQKKRDLLVETLEDFGMPVYVPEGGYYLIANWTTVADKVNLTNEIDDKMDFKVVKWMIKNIKVLGLPMSGFYSENSTNLREDFVRFTFIKTDEYLAEADYRFRNWMKEGTKNLPLILLKLEISLSIV